MWLVLASAVDFPKNLWKFQNPKKAAVGLSIPYTQAKFFDTGISGSQPHFVVQFLTGTPWETSRDSYRP